MLPPTVQVDYAGQTREFRQTGSNLAIVFVLALLFIYLVLAAQFESFVDPFVILLSVPLSLAGALAALWLTGGTLNVYSQIGLVTLIGLITRHGILIVEFTNQLGSRAGPGSTLWSEAPGASVEADPHDDGRDGARLDPAGARERRGRGEPPADRLGDRRRNDLRHAADALRRADRLQLPGA